MFDYYKARYVPNNLTFVVVGDVDADAVYAQLAKFFGEDPEHLLAAVYIPAEFAADVADARSTKEFTTELSVSACPGRWNLPHRRARARPALDHSPATAACAASQSPRGAGLAFSVGAFSYTPGDPGILGDRRHGGTENASRLSNSTDRRHYRCKA